MQPIIFELGPIQVYSLWLFIAIAIVAGTYIFVKLAQKSRLRLQFILDSLVPVLTASVIGARLFAVIQNYQFYLHEFSVAQLYSIIAFWRDKEMSFWGAILGATYIFYRQANKKQENVTKWADIFIISLMTGLCIGNFGAFLDGINYGKETNLPIGIAFDSPIVRYTVPIHPTQIYAMIYTGLIALTTYYIYRRYKNHADGIVFWIGATLFSIFKVIEGFFRGDDVILIWIIRLPELVFLLLFIVGLHKIYYYQKKTPLPFLRKYEQIYGSILKKFKITNHKKNV